VRLSQGDCACAWPQGDADVGCAARPLYRDDLITVIAAARREPARASYTALKVRLQDTAELPSTLPWKQAGRLQGCHQASHSDLAEQWDQVPT